MGRYLVLGLGKSGLSTTHFLRRRNATVKVADTRARLPDIETLTDKYPDLDIYLGDLPIALLEDVDQLVISPGLSPAHPLVQVAKQKGIQVIGDVELFCRQAQAPIIAITGTNAKSTVVTLIADIITDAGFKVALGGNIGIPVLDLLDSAEGEPDFYVLELSSFQLETTYSLKSKVAAVLNVSPDHMDRYADFSSYTQAKQRIYAHCEWALYNRDDAATRPSQNLSAPGGKTKLMSFGLQAAVESDVLSYNLLKNGDSWLAQGQDAVFPVCDLKLSGVHNHINCLAALAVSDALGISRLSVQKTLRNFRGLVHRCEWVTDIGQVRWINDSKGTNVGSTLAALRGYADEYSGKIVLLLGGVSKGADFTPLRQMITQHVKIVIVYGRDAAKIQNDLAEAACPVINVDDFDLLIKKAHYEAGESGLVLFSPACASFDMFKNFEERGDEFKKRVHDLKHGLTQSVEITL